MAMLPHEGIPPETDWGKCPHGFQRGVNRLPSGTYAAPIGKCRCCGTHFMYIGSATISAKVQDFEDPDPTLCRQCGAAPRRLRREDGEIVLNEAGSHGC